MYNPKDQVARPETSHGVTPLYADGEVEQDWNSYVESEHDVWSELYSKQRELVFTRASRAYLEGLEELGFSNTHIPRFEDVNQTLLKRTGWKIVGVNGLLSSEAFFRFLSRRVFPVTRWIRSREQMGYLVEPDLFHDLFGHVPMFVHESFANFVEAYGKACCEKIHDSVFLEAMNRLYWYTVEFGLVLEDERLKIYGGGILSSSSEVVYSLESQAPHRLPMKPSRVMQTGYRIDDFQRTYFVLDGIEHLYKLADLDMQAIVDDINVEPGIDPSFLEAGETDISLPG